MVFPLGQLVFVRRAADRAGGRDCRVGQHREIGVLADQPHPELGLLGGCAQPGAKGDPLPSPGVSR
jgi:hypothetical protein